MIDGSVCSAAVEYGVRARRRLAFGKGIFRKIWIATEAAVRTETIHPDLHSAVDRFTLLVLHA